MDYEELTKVEVSTKKMKYTIESKGPNNFYFITPSKGFAPSVLNGAYTTIDAAKRDLTNYLKNLGKDEVD